MRRYTLLLAGSSALFVLALVPAWYAVSATAADRPSSPAAAGSSAATGQGAAKSLYSVPEDGSGNDDFPASSRLVRDLVSAHPAEDLVICIAGCRPGADRVIFAQPVDPHAKKPAVAEAQPVAATPAAAEVTPAAPAAAAAGETATPAANDTAKSAGDAPAGDAAGEASETAKSEPAEGQTRLEPTAAEPEEPGPREGGEEGPSAQEMPSEPAGEPASDAPSE